MSITYESPSGNVIHANTTNKEANDHTQYSLALSGNNANGEYYEEFNNSMTIPEIQTIIDGYNNTKYDVNVTFRFLAGDYTYNNGTIDIIGIETHRGAKLSIEGADDRAYTGLAFMHGQVTNPDISSTVTNLSLNGTYDVVTITPASYDLDAEGYGAGDFIDIQGLDASSSTVYERAEILSISGQDITLTAPLNSIQSFVNGSYIAIIANTVINDSIVFDVQNCDIYIENICCHPDFPDCQRDASNTIELSNTCLGYYTRRSSAAKNWIGFNKITFNQVYSILGTDYFNCKNILAENLYILGEYNYNRFYDCNNLRFNILGNIKQLYFERCINLFIQNWANFHRFNCCLQLVDSSKGEIRNAIIENIVKDTGDIGLLIARASSLSIWNSTIENWDTGIYAIDLSNVAERGMTYTNNNVNWSPSSSPGNTYSNIG